MNVLPHLLRRFFLLASLLVSLCLQLPAQTAPNIVVILADDMGFSDLGCYGGEIQTPALDGLAASGLKFRRFYNTAKCSPTRASLLSGQYPHAAGMENLTTSGGGNSPAYLGYLSDETVTLAEVLGQNGYGTYMSGKWHVGENQGRWPLDRGFDRYWGLISGANSFWELLTQYGRQMALDNTPWNPATDYTAADLTRHGRTDFYMTDATADYAIDFLDEHQTNRPSDPFLLYMSFTAPHWPLHAYESDIDTYDGVYDQGWDVTRQNRLNEMINLGLLPPGTTLTPRDGNSWNSRPADDGDQDIDLDQGDLARRMQTYAAQVDRMDQAIAKLVQYLQANNLFDNTLILFLSDNGGSAEDVSGRNRHVAGTLVGEEGSYMSYLKEWSNVSNAPFRRHKNEVEEGGIATPLIVSWPDGIQNGGTGLLTEQVGHVKDILPTALEVANVPYPAIFGGNTLLPLAGESFAHLFTNPSDLREREIFFEYNGERAVRFGKWKIISQSTNGSWDLYDMEADPTEVNDLSGTFPGIVSTLSARYEIWETEVGHQSGTLPDPLQGPTLANALADESVPEGVPFSFTLPATAFSDEAADQLVYEAQLSDGSPLPAWLVFNGLDRTFSGQAGVGDLTTPLDIEVTAIDWDGNTATDQFLLSAGTGGPGTGTFSLIEEFNYVTGDLAAVSSWVPGGGNNGVANVVAQGAAIPSRASNGLSAEVATAAGGAAYNYNPGTDGDNYFDQPIDLPLNVFWYYGIDCRIDDVNALPDQSNLRSFIEWSLDGNLNNTTSVRTRFLNDNGALTAAVALGGGSSSPNDFSANTTDGQGHQLVVRAFWDGTNITFDAALDPDLDPANVTWTPVGTQAAAGSSIELVRLFIGTGGSSSPAFSGLFPAIRLSTDYAEVVKTGDGAPFLTGTLADQGPFLEGDAFSFVLADVFDDPEEGNALVYTASLDDGSSLPAWLAFDANTRTFSALAGSSQTGTYAIEVTGTDQAGQAVSATFSLEISPAGGQPVVLYREVFGNDNSVVFNGNPDPLDPPVAAAWANYLGSNAIEMTVFGRTDPTPKAAISGFDGKPTNLDNVNAGTTLSQVDGFLFAATGGVAPLLSFTEEFSLDLAVYQNLSFSWYQGHGSAATTALAIRIGTDWYVSTATQTNVIVNGAGNFTADAELKTVNFDPAAANWQSLTFDPVGGTLSLGSTPGSDLPLGQMNAWGFFSDGDPSTVRLDAFEISGIANALSQPPVAAFTATPLSGLGPLDVTFDASGSSDDVAVVSYDWDFGDGNNGSGVNPTHTYASGGSYTATLTVTDGDNQVATATENIEVTQPVSVPYRINVGGSDYTKDGDLFVAEELAYLVETQPTQLGTTAYTPYNVPGGHTDLYYPRRFGPEFSYVFPVANGDYQVALHMLENFQSAAGARVFDVEVEGNLVLDNFDLFATYGQGNLAIETFNVTVADQELNIDFTGVVNFGIVMAIEVLPAPVSSTLTGSVPIPAACDGRAAEVFFYDAGTTNLVQSEPTTVDANGEFVLTNLTPGTYDLYVKVEGYLQKVAAGEALVAGANSVAFGTLQGGDADGNNQVNAIDFSILSATYNMEEGDAGYDARADFNCDGQVGAIDFSLLSGSYNQAGDTP